MADNKANEADQGWLVNVRKADAPRLKQWVTELKSAERQIGEHIIQALQDEDTVAVLTTAVIGPDGTQRLVSAGLPPSIMQQVQTLLGEAGEERDEDVPCIGFHCFVRKHGAEEKKDGVEQE